MRTEYHQSKAAWRAYPQVPRLVGLPRSQTRAPVSVWKEHGTRWPRASSQLATQGWQTPALAPWLSTGTPSPPPVARLPGRYGMQGVCNPTCRHPRRISAEVSQMSFFPPKSTRGISPRLDVLAGDPVDFELFSGSIKQGLQSGIKGVSLLCALWESWSCGLASLFVRHGIPA